MTKDEIINCTDEQALADAIAVEVMGWQIFPDGAVGWLGKEAVDMDGNRRFHEVVWEPHKQTEKGKAQAIDLAEKFGLDISMPYDSSDTALANLPNGKDVEDYRWQIAVLKAALLSVKEGE